MGWSARHGIVLSFLALAPALLAQGPAPRRPRGIYAVVNVEQNVKQQQANSITPAQLNAYFDTLYQGLLDDSAISGLTLQVHWDTLNPNAPPAANAYDWDYVDDAFAQAAAWNLQNPAAPKTVQLIVTAGFQTPQWVLVQIPSCDGLFQSPSQTPSSTCGTATFQGYSEAGDGTELPLPWNPFYKSSWQTFLTALAARYGSNPAFVSIAVAGPTAASAEMILPNDGNSNNPQTQFGADIAPNAMWRQLLAFHYAGMPAYQNSDQAFIDEWDAAIDTYGEIFSGVTLVATTGNGLPNFSSKFTVPNAFSADCGTQNMDCAAETTILSYFVEPTVGGANAKATQTSGMEASRANGLNLTVASAKRLSQSTQCMTPSAQILAGAQFNTNFAKFTLQEGCTSTFPPNAGDTPPGCVIPSTCNVQGCIPVECIPQACLAPGVTQAALASYKTFINVPSSDLIPPEQAEYNVLNYYFDGTEVASFFGGTQGAEPVNYLQIYSEDIQYAEANVNAPAQVVETGGATVATSAQALLNLASQNLLEIGEAGLLPTPPPTILPGGIVPAYSSSPTIQSGEWASIYGTNLASGTATWTGNFPVSLGGTSATINGKSAYLLLASPSQINLQVPNDAASGAVPVVVTTACGVATSTVTLAPFGPSFFLLDAKHVAGIILRSNGSYDIIGPTGTSLGYATVAAKAGDTIELFGNGFGPTNPAVPAGQVFSGAAPTSNTVTLRINNMSVPPTFAGLSGAGLYQLNLTVPSGLGTGDVSLQAAVGGAPTPSGVVISLQ